MTQNEKRNTKKRIERLKRNGKYEAYLAKRREQALRLYHGVDEEGVCQRKEREKNAIVNGSTI